MKQILLLGLSLATAVFGSQISDFSNTELLRELEQRLTTSGSGANEPSWPKLITFYQGSNSCSPSGLKAMTTVAFKLGDDFDKKCAEVADKIKNHPAPVWNGYKGINTLIVNGKFCVGTFGGRTGTDDVVGACLDAVSRSKFSTILQ